MAFIAFRRRLLILLVPIINFVFLVLFIFLPASLPRLPRISRTSPLFPKLTKLILYDDGESSLEHIRFPKTLSHSNQDVVSNSDPAESARIAGDRSPALEQGSTPDNNSAGIYYLLEQRKLVEGVQLTPLPDHLISTYRPGYLDSSLMEDQEYQQRRQSMDLEKIKDQDIDLDPSMKYLTFLPHSGFHNQRTELENAILLARLLNRTLIMPKVYLGPPMPWITFRRLHERLLYQTKIGLEHCRAIIESREYETAGYAGNGYSSTEPTIFQPLPLQQPELQQSSRPLVSSEENMSSQEQLLEHPLPQQGESVHQRQRQHHHHSPSQHHHHHRYQEKTQRQENEEPLHDYRSESESASDGDVSLPSPQHQYIEDEVEDRYAEETQFVPGDVPREFDAAPDMDTGRVAGMVMSEGERSGDSDIGEQDWSTEEDNMSSWIEEPEDTDGEQPSIATGDGVSQIMGLKENWIERGSGQSEWQDEERYDDEENDEDDTIGMGIIDDWSPDSYEAPEQQQIGHDGNRLLSQKLDEEPDLPLYMSPLDFRTNIRMADQSMFNEMRSNMPVDDKYQGVGRSRIQKRQESLPPQQPRESSKITQRRNVEWSSLPAECLRYESWTMTDWDVFFDLNPLRRYVRILTRESMSMAYLADRFNLTLAGDVNTNPPKANESSSGAGTEGATEGEPKDGHEESGDEESDSGNETEDEKKVIPLLRSEGDILFFDDSNLYDYRFTENPDTPESLRTKSKFGQEFTIDWLAQRPERLIHLGSIFGTGRVVIDSLESRAWQLMIRDHLILSTEILQSTSQRIVDRISSRTADHFEELHPDKQTFGEPMLDPLEVGFVGIHIRMSDGHFSLAARDTIENIRQELMWQMNIKDEDEDEDGYYGHGPTDTDPALKKQPRLSIEQCRSRALNHRRSLQEQLRQPRQQQPQQQNQQIQQKTLPSTTPLQRSNGRFTPIYLATDAHRPRSNPIFDRLFETFDCVFTLDDFSKDLEPLRHYRNPEDGTLMSEFLIPMVDAMVVAKSAAFFGTPASTFSNYIQKQLRPAYTGLYE